MNATSSPHLTVRRNALWNILGIGVPLAIAFFFIPQLIEGMGTNRFGVLTLIIAFLNYFGIFDLGIGRALTQVLASGLEGGEEEEASLIWTASGLLVLIGAVLGLALYLAAPALTVHVMRIHDPLLGSETAASLRQVAFVIPFLLHSLALRGVLESRRRFDLSNIVRLPVVAFTFGVPFLVLPFSSDLRVIVPVILAGRIIAWLLNVGMIMRIMPHVRSFRWRKPANVGALARMGGWFTVSSIVAPLLDNMDRFFISAFLSVSLVAYYTTPYELITRLGIISAGVGGVMFPEFASRLKTGPEAAAALFRRGFKYVLAMLFPFVLLATAYAHEGLTIWLNPEFAALSAPVLRWLSLLVFVMGASIVPFLFLGGAGRADLPARMHLIELPLHAGLLYALIHLDGLRGAAIACVIRMTVDFSGMLYFSGTIMGFRAASYARIVIPMGVVVAVLLCFHLPMPSLLKAVLVGLTLAFYTFAVWSHVLEKQDKAALLRVMRWP